jgi:hypothetical protein
MRATRPDLFEFWTAEECWLAGLLWADGCLHDRGRGRRAIIVGQVDEGTVAEAARIAGCRHSSYAQKPPRQTIHQMTIGERVAVTRIADAGLAEPKLSTRTWPDLPHMDAFLRGLFDGDGSVLWHQQGGRRKTPTTPLRLYTQFCGSLPLLEGVQTYLADFGISPKKILFNGKTRPIRKIAWNHADSLRFRSVIYAVDGPCMARKREIFFRDHSDPRATPTRLQDRAA